MNFCIQDGRCPSHWLLDVLHFHVEETLDTTLPPSSNWSLFSNSFFLPRANKIEMNFAKICAFNGQNFSGVSEQLSFAPQFLC